MKVDISFFHFFSFPCMAAYTNITKLSDRFLETNENICLLNMVCKILLETKNQHCPLTVGSQYINRIWITKEYIFEFSVNYNILDNFLYIHTDPNL